jgi:hypothetical protein
MDGFDDVILSLCSYQSYYVFNGITYFFEIYGEPLLMNRAYLGSLEIYNAGVCADLPTAVDGPWFS